MKHQLFFLVLLVSCLNACVAAEVPIDVDVNVDVKEQIFKCNQGDAQSCMEVGNAYLKGEGVPYSREQKIEYFEKACSLNNSDACLTVGTDYALSDGLKGQLTDRPLIFYRKACALGNAVGCRTLGLVYEEGLYKQKKSLFLAREYLGKACELAPEELCKDYFRLKRMELENKS